MNDRGGGDPGVYPVGGNDTVGGGRTPPLDFDARFVHRLDPEVSRCTRLTFRRPIADDFCTVSPSVVCIRLRLTLDLDITKVTPRQSNPSREEFLFEAPAD